MAVRVTPKASRERIQGIAVDDDGRAAIRISVTAAPEDGKANAALIRLLAREWRVPRRAISVALGRTDRRKVLAVTGPPAELAERIETWMRERGLHDRNEN